MQLETIKSPRQNAKYLKKKSVKKRKINCIFLLHQKIIKELKSISV